MGSLARSDEYYGKCISCSYSKYNDLTSKGVYCTKYGDRYDIKDSCSKYNLNNNLSDRQITDFLKQVNDLNDSTSCFITTILVRILGLSDDCYILDSFRDFRTNHLRKDESQKELLATYDVVGPVIAKNLETDVDNVNFAMHLYETYLLKISNYVGSLEDHESYHTAIRLYKDMVYYLCAKYNITVPLKDIASYMEMQEQNKMGHGYVKVR